MDLPSCRTPHTEPHRVRAGVQEDMCDH